MTARARGRMPLAAWLAVEASLVLIGCGDDETSKPESDTVQEAAGAKADANERSDAGVRDDADNGAAAVLAECEVGPITEAELQDQAKGASVFGQVTGGHVGLFDALNAARNCGLAGVSVCLLGTDHCTESDAAGQFVLEDLPEGEKVQIELTKADFRPTLRVAQLADIPINLRQSRLVLDAELESLFADADLPYDPAKGSIVAVALAAGEAIGGVVVPADVEITLQPEGLSAVYSLGSPEAGGLSSDELDQSLHATRFGGWGIFANVEQGMPSIRFERNGEVCDQGLPGYGYGADDDGNIMIEVIAGHTTTSVAAFCP